MPVYSEEQVPPLLGVSTIGRTSEHFIITAHLDISPRPSLKYRRHELILHSDTSARKHVRRSNCAALQHTTSLAYLEYCEIPSYTSADVVSKKIIEKLRDLIEVHAEAIALTPQNDNLGG